MISVVCSTLIPSTCLSLCIISQTLNPSWLVLIYNPLPLSIPSPHPFWDGDSLCSSGWLQSLGHPPSSPPQRWDCSLEPTSPWLGTLTQRPRVLVDPLTASSPPLSDLQPLFLCLVLWTPVYILFFLKSWNPLEYRDGFWCLILTVALQLLKCENDSKTIHVKNMVGFPWGQGGGRDKTLKWSCTGCFPPSEKLSLMLLFKASHHYHPRIPLIAPALWISSPKNEWLELAKISIKLCTTGIVLRKAKDEKAWG